MKSIAILTATRAEYGLLSPIIHALEDINKYNIRVVATGAHLSPEFGMTYKEIESDGVKIDRKIEMLISSDKPSAISKSMGIAMISFADYFNERRPDALVVLGDRYETLAVCIAAMNERIPIIHLYGGETTEGAIDEAIRHSITKMSYLHLTSTDEYRNRVIQLGEDPKRVFNVGSIGIENALKVKLLSKEELEQSVNFKLDKPYAVVTFHPVTLEGLNAKEQAEELLTAVDMCGDMKFIFTCANADANGRVINELLEKYVKKHANCILFESLGMKRYLSALKYADFVMGNSSSGLIEVPTFKIPTVNIGDRQKGRLKAESVIDCKPNRDSITEAIIKARSNEFKELCGKVNNPYGDGNTSEKIVSIINKVLSHPMNLKKKFYDVK